ncbi:MAG: GAF domain-containing sensor histidine kinase [Chloroflexota bacterium]
MLSNILSSKNSRKWMYLFLKVAMIIAFSLLILVQYPRTITNVMSVRDIAYPAGVGLITVLIIIIATLIRQTNRYVPFMVIVADIALIAAYIYYMPNPEDNNYLIPMGITIIITLSGILYLGAIFGIIAIIGSLAASSVAYLARPEVVPETIFQNLEPITPVVLIGVFSFVVALIWHLVIDEENSRKRVEVRQEIKESRKALDDMRGRTSALAEMATRINASLQFDSILDASLDLGRLSVRDTDSARVVSMALMVTSEDDELTIEAHRGLTHTDLHHTFAGKRGVIAKAMDTGEPIIYDGGKDDPELRVVRAFALVKSTLVIPLRANFETYGVLVFGSSARNAINENHYDTLTTIGVQATVALQNAVLYHNLREEKERILRIEENGRKALVRDLHDIPTQTVSAVAMHLSTIPTIMKRYPERVEDEVTNIREMALRATTELRHVMFTIRPLSLEASGLKTALDQLSEKMYTTYKQPMQAKVDSRIEDLLDKDAKSSLFYLVEEAANNARKYAKASMIQVVATLQKNEIIVRVRDNGRGFNMAEVGADYENRGSFGLVNMRERAELINGTFELQSAVGKGTTVTVRVPVKTGQTEQRTPILKPRRSTRKQYTGPMSPSA